MALARGSERSNALALITPKRIAAAALIMAFLFMTRSLCAAETEAPDTAEQTTPTESLPPDVIAAKLSAQVAAQQLEAKRLAEKILLKRLSYSTALLRP